MQILTTLVLTGGARRWYRIDIRFQLRGTLSESSCRIAPINWFEQPTAAQPGIRIFVFDSQITADATREQIQCQLVNFGVLCGPTRTQFLWMVASKDAGGWWVTVSASSGCGSWRLSSEAIQAATLTLEGVDDVHCGDGLAASMLGVGHGVTDDVLKKHLEYSSGLLVDEAGDALNTSSACETANGGLGDVITKDYAVTLAASLAESLFSFSAARYGNCSSFFVAFLPKHDSYI